MKIICISICILLGLVSCGSTKSGTRYDALASSAPLRTHVDRGSDLLKVNSLVVFPVELGEKVKASNLSEIGFYEDLLVAVNEAIDIEVHAGRDLFSEVKTYGMQFTRREAIDIAKKRGSDAVLLTRITNYNEREGSSVGVSNPASVDFSMSIVRVLDGKAIWEASYHFKDQALSEDLFRIDDRVRNRQGLAWSSARVLLKKGFHAAAQDFARKRITEFSLG